MHKRFETYIVFHKSITTHLKSNFFVLFRKSDMRIDLILNQFFFFGFRTRVSRGKKFYYVIFGYYFLQVVVLSFLSHYYSRHASMRPLILFLGRKTTLTYTSIEKEVNCKIIMHVWHLYCAATFTIFLVNVG